MTEDNSAAAGDNAISMADKARAKAEARRQRILKGASQRLGVVAGESQREVTATENGEGENLQPLEGNAAAVSATSTAASTPAPKASTGSSRLQAMRRRRFKKQTTAPKEDEGNKPSTAPIKSEPTAEATNGNNGSKAASNNQDNAPPSTDDKSVATSASGTTTKKYKGVARMRRQMLKNKQKQATTDETEAVDTEATTAVVSKKRSKKNASAKWSIYMHMLTILLLFFTGVWIGFHRQIVSPDAVIHRELIILQRGGIEFITQPRRFLSFQKQDPKALLQQKSNEWNQQGQAGTEEFDDQANDDNEDVEMRIDPLFGVDLDLYTRGDGFIYAAARVAVVIHRWNLYLLFDLPRSMFASFMALPATLWKTPPILCLASLFIRQVIAKQILGGAALPTPDDDTPKEDVLNMLKRGVMNVLTSMLPSVVGLYDAFTHLRSDMFVILCGVLVGLAGRYVLHLQELEGGAALWGPTLSKFSFLMGEKVKIPQETESKMKVAGDEL